VWYIPTYLEEAIMIVQKDFLNRLKDFGLNSYESKLWTALLSRGISTAGELSDIAGVPRSRSYDVLESLEKKGFIIMKIGKPIKYIAVSPEEVLERVKKKLIEDAETKSLILEKVRNSEIINELNLLHTQGINLIEPTEFSGALKSRANIYNHMESMINSAKKSIIIMTSEEGIIRKADVFKNALSKAKDRGVKIKIVAPITKKSYKPAKSISKIAEVKHNTDINARFCMVDGKDITFMLSDDKNVHPTYDTAIWVSTSLFSKAFEDFFNNSWQLMKPLNTIKH
jgi:sugar-specific transcriptional regulator TrmB